jgi:hypothetical protein
MSLEREHARKKRFFAANNHDVGHGIEVLLEDLQNGSSQE